MILATVLGLAIFKAIAIIAVLTAFNFKRVLGYEVWIDTAIGVALLAVYHGSAHGILIATLAGVIVSIVLRACRWLFGYEKYSFARARWEYHPR